MEPRLKDVQLFYQRFCNNQDAGLVNLAYVVDDERGERDSNRSLPFPQIPSLTEMITRVSVAGLLTAGMIAAGMIAAGMIAAARYRHFICFFLPPTLYNVEFLRTSHLISFSMQVYGALHWCGASFIHDQAVLCAVLRNKIVGWYGYLFR